MIFVWKMVPFAMVTIHEKTKHNVQGHQSEIQAKIVAQADNYYFSLFYVDP